VLCLLAVLFCVTCVSAQIPIPNRYDGFGQGEIDAPILFEAFFDLLCPDCAGAWPNIKDVVNYYNSNASHIRFLLHTFPLPYHHNAFYAAQGTHIVNAVNSKLLWQYVDAMFLHQDKFWDGATADDSSNQVQSAMAATVQDAIGFDQNDFIQGLGNATLNMDTRISWKYGCSRGVAWTPAFFVNGISVLADPTWTLNDWRIILDPLISHSGDDNDNDEEEDKLGKCPVSVQKMRALLPLRDTHTPNDCPPGQFPCTYKAGKTQCCLNGEHCIPNVGCRC